MMTPGESPRDPSALFIARLSARGAVAALVAPGSRPTHQALDVLLERDHSPVSTPSAARLRLRPGTPADVPLVLSLIRELATYERAPDAVVATEEGLLRDGFGAVPLFRTLIAELDGAPVGFALYFLAYSTWRGQPTLYLEDLFVQPAARGHGAGKAMMQALAAEALQLGCGRFVWQVLDWNEPSIRFYESLGAEVVREWLTCRLEGEPLRALATSDTP